jgi:hypothetical protein
MRGRGRRRRQGLGNGNEREAFWTANFRAFFWNANGRECLREWTRIETLTCTGFFGTQIFFGTRMSALFLEREWTRIETLTSKGFLEREWVRMARRLAPAVLLSTDGPDDTDGHKRSAPG